MLVARELVTLIGSNSEEVCDASNGCLLCSCAPSLFCSRADSSNCSGPNGTSFGILFIIRGEG